MLNGRRMIVVTGGTGLVGSHLLYQLTSLGYPVRAIKRAASNVMGVKKIFHFYSDAADALFQKIEWIDADVLDPVSLEEAFEGAEKVYHAAAFVSFLPSLKRKVFESNIYGTANVVNACLQQKVKKLCHVSSVAALGNAVDGSPVTEDLIWSPGKHRSYYSISKFHSEMEIWRGIEEGLNAVMVNPSIILGPGNWEKSSAALFSEIYKGLRFYPTGSNGYVDVKDVVKIMIQLMESDISAERFILNSENCSYEHVFTLIANNLHKPEPNIEAKRWMGELGWRMEWLRSRITQKNPQITRETVASGFSHCHYSSDKIKKVLGTNFISLESSIQETAALFLRDYKQK
jgi:dihydroflavonol-4-reductase